MVLLHLIDVTRDMSFLNRNPAGEAQASVGWMIPGVFPDRFGQRDKQLIRCFAQATNNFERLARALMKITQSPGPASGIKFQDRALRLCYKTAAADVGAGFAVSKVQNNFVDAPTVR
ncbi:MAG: hypothetical protein WCD43_13835 [Candidatus Acidiferrales bacterium]